MYNPISQDPISFDKEYPSTLAPILFYNKGSKILGTLFIAEGKGPHSIILLLHGFPGNETNFDLAHIYRRLGFNVLVIHYRGCWGSEGQFSFNNCLEDVQATIKYIKSELNFPDSRIDTNNIILIGYSLGGFASLLTSINDDSLKNVCSIAGFNFGLFTKKIPHIEGAKEITIESLSNSCKYINSVTPNSLFEEMIENKEKWNLLNYTKELSTKNLLFIAAKHDNIAPIDIHHSPLTKTLSALNPSNIEDIILDSGHSFSNKRIALADLTIYWLKKIKENIQ